MTTSRRKFLQSSAAAGTAALAANWGLIGNVNAQGSDVIRVGLIGCGGRGTGAAMQCLRGGPNVRLVAVGDAFEEKINSCLENLNREEDIRNMIGVPANRRFVGLDAHERVVENCDLVLLATPPGFRPYHLRTAIRARKHVFTEKPVCVDGPGARLCYELFEEANRNNLSIVAGTQRRYQPGYVESMQHIHDGGIGTITSARCYWNQGTLWVRPREAGWTDLQWQIKNWLYFTWLSGDHICEQHVHNLDVVNWALGNSHPVRAVGLGGRQVRVEPQFGHIYDHFAVDYEYPNQVHVTSMCRQMAGCEQNVSETVTGTRGVWNSSNQTITGDRPWSFPRGRANGENDPYQLEHIALIGSIRGTRPRLNDLKNVTDSSLTAVMGRMACYTGQVVTWDNALNSPVNTMPQNLAWDMQLPVPGVAVPGRR